MDYELLETFIVISETLNITKTANILFKTQPTISKRIQKLESIVGFKLVTRNKGKHAVILTNKGIEFLSIAKKLLQLYKEINMVDKHSILSLNIATIDSVGVIILPEICNQLIQRVEINLSIRTYQTQEIYNLVQNGLIDIGFVSDDIQTRGITCIPIFKQKFYVIKPCDHPGPIERMHPKDLDPRFEVFQPWNKEFIQWHANWWDKPPIIVDSNALMLPFFLKGESWSIIQSTNLEDLKKKISIQVYELDIGPPPRTNYMIMNTLSHTHPSKAMTVFSSILHEYVKNSDILIPV